MLNLLTLEATDLACLALAEATRPSKAAVEELLASAMDEAVERFNALAHAATLRLLAQGDNVWIAPNLFDAQDLLALTELLASVRGTADLFGRALVRDYHGRVTRGGLRESVHLFEEVDPPGLLTPEGALRFFLGLIPRLGIDPGRWGADQRRSSFTLAVATGVELLGRVQGFLTDLLRTGQGVRDAPREIEALLDTAGVSSNNPQYGEMVVRTNLMDSFNQGLTDEMRDPDVADAFPAWEYLAIVDERSRPHHAARNGLYYPAGVNFVDVRGKDIADVANCRCSFRPIGKREWLRLKGRGARLRGE